MATKDKFYADIPLSFIPNPTTGDIRAVVNEMSVKNGLTNLLRSRPGSRPFNPEYGIDIEKYLFEMADPITESMLNDQIGKAIKQFEPRVELSAIESTITDNGIEVKIEYYVSNVPSLQTLETTLTRT